MLVEGFSGLLKEIRIRYETEVYVGAEKPRGVREEAWGRVEII